ncbi:MAG: flagellar hook-length control protein FliK, partial [Pseudomonadota bacterium]
LNPEGLGQIQLKVATEGEQVKVDMIAESNEAKKLIEKGLGDLKATLSSHKLNVENLKVDLAADIQKQFDHAHDEAQRQSAQQFMESFREQNGSWRQSFFDMPGVRAPGSGLTEDGLTLETLEQRKKAKSSRRLDLVA